ncbi:hypothetical protein A2U01_0051887, partial [Trifolium medium]|nr:hypothetical protein [Trifolium medium]
MIGHNDKLCRNQALDLDTLAPLGPWISPPVPSDLLEKLAAMKVNTPKDTPAKHTPPEQANQHPQSHDNPTMNGIQITQADRGKKAHRLAYNNEAMHM